MRGSMRGDHARPSPMASLDPNFCGQVAQVTECVFGAMRDQNLLARLEEGLQPVAPIADDRGAAGCGLEQARAGPVTCGGRLATGDVEREALSVVKVALIPRIEI